MKQLVILSGKGGTGKTSVTAAFAHLATEGPSPLRAVLADADVEAANLGLVLNPQEREAQDFWAGKSAVIEAEACSACGQCAKVCRFEAIHFNQGVYEVDPVSCEGCASCAYACPDQAISMSDQKVGRWFRSQSRFGPLFHAELFPASENSGKLVTLIKQQARLLALDEGYEALLVDGPPGIGCPVIAAASGADLALVVAEPTAAGIHDMERILETTRHFGVPTLLCVNKHDLHPEGTVAIEAHGERAGARLVGKIPFDLSVTQAMVQGEPVTHQLPRTPASVALGEVWEQVIQALKEEA